MKNAMLLKYSSSSITTLSPMDQLLDNRAIMLDSSIDADTASDLIALLSCLNAKSSDPIHLYLNSPGGSISDGLAVIDCMRGISSPVFTHAYGMAASMAAIILACGEPGGRFAAPSAEVMVHQPLTFGSGAISADGLAENAARILAKKHQIERILADATGLSGDALAEMMMRDTWLSAERAVELGFVDCVETTWMPFLVKESSWE